MSDQKFTPGPWVKYHGGGHLYSPERGSWEIHFGTTLESVADYVYEKADADLIAAAPELYKMLSDFRDDPEYFLGDEKVLCMHDIDEILAKARGE